jgi:hypothetical protein
LHAAEIAKLAHQVARISDGEQPEQDEISGLLEHVAHLTTLGKGSAVSRLFGPHGQQKCAAISANNEGGDFDMGPATKVRERRRIGWLAHYNAAIFFSMALDTQSGLPNDYLVDGEQREGEQNKYDVDRWKMDCARAAIRELAYAKRDPRNHLEPDWYRRDPGLAPLGRYMGDRDRGRRWAMFVGLALGE